jgi:hypothetical protein
VSTQLADPRQDPLFAMPRDWSRVTRAERPALTPGAQALLAEFHQAGRDQHWELRTRHRTGRALALALAWHGADAPIREEDLRGIAAVCNGLSAERVVSFLRERERLRPDPQRHADPHHRAITQHLHSLPPAFAADLERWVLVMRGGGRRAHPGRSYQLIRRYLEGALPLLRTWSRRYTALREVSAEDIKSALGQRTGAPARMLNVSLRSVFRALRQERLIFRDPSRGISVSAQLRLPAPLPTERLGGLLDRAPHPLTRLLILLTAVHPLTPSEVRHLTLADLDLATARLHLHRAGRRHTIHLEQATLRAVMAWLNERNRRRPRSTNPHLLITPEHRRRRPPATDEPLRGEGTTQCPRGHRPRRPHRPHPHRGHRDRRPRPPHAGLRHLRRDRHTLHRRRPPRPHRPTHTVTHPAGSGDPTRSPPKQTGSRAAHEPPA